MASLLSALTLLFGYCQSLPQWIFCDKAGASQFSLLEAEGRYFWQLIWQMFLGPSFGPAAGIDPSLRLPEEQSLAWTVNVETQISLFPPSFPVFPLLPLPVLLRFGNSLSCLCQKCFAASEKKTKSNLQHNTVIIIISHN